MVGIGFGFLNRFGDMGGFPGFAHMRSLESFVLNSFVAGFPGVFDRVRGDCSLFIFYSGEWPVIE